MTTSLLYVAGANRELGYLKHWTSPGIACYALDEETGAATELAVTRGVDNPTFIALSPDRTLLAAITEFEGWNEGTVTLFAVGADQTLTYLNKQATRGDTTAHVGFSPDGTMVGVANYGVILGGPPGNGVALYRAAGAGLSAPVAEARHSGTGPRTDRQEQPHAHCVRWSPDGRFLTVTDLGIDRVVIYDNALRRHGDCALPPGAGPRHLVFHRRQPLAYVVTELSAEVATLAWDAVAGTLSVVALTPVAPGGTGPNQPSGIAISPDGNHLMIANRQQNTIVSFAIDAATGVPAFGTAVPATGTPRDIAFSPSGRVLAVANQDTDQVVLFRHVAGVLTPLGRIEVGTPTVAVFV